MTEAGSTEKQKQEATSLLEKQHEEIEKYAKAAEAELESKHAIEQKLKSLEKRVLHGGENMVEKMSELKKLAKATKAELEVQRCTSSSICFCRPAFCTETKYVAQQENGALAFFAEGNKRNWNVE
jgi:hypothetical protein